MYCYKCGTKLDNDARFCTSCGTKVEEELKFPGTESIDEEAEETKIIGQLDHHYGEDNIIVEHIDTAEASRPQLGTEAQGYAYGGGAANAQGMYGQPVAYGQPVPFGQNGQPGQDVQNSQAGYQQNSQAGYQQNSQVGFQQNAQGQYYANQNQAAQGYMPRVKPEKGRKRGILVLIIVGALLACCGMGYLVWSLTGGKSTPQKTIGNMEDAINNRDIDALIDLCDSASSSLLKAYIDTLGNGSMDQAFDELENLTMELNVKDITYEGDDKCTAEINSVIRSNEGLITEDTDIPMVKEKGKWKINLSDTFIDGIF